MPAVGAKSLAENGPDDACVSIRPASGE